METLVIFVIVLGALHLLYETVILPSILLHLSFKFNKLKDDIIFLTIKDKSNVSPIEFNYIMHSLNSCENNLSKFTIATLIQINIFVKKNRHLIDEKSDVDFNKFENKDLVKSHEKSIKYMSYALLANSFMLIFYLFPLIIITIFFALVYHFVSKKGKKKYKQLIKEIRKTTESDIQNVPINGYYLI